MITTFDEGRVKVKNGRYITPSLRKVLLVLTILVLLILSAGIFLFAVLCVRYAKGRDRASGHSDSKSSCRRRTGVFLRRISIFTEVLMGNVQASTIGAAQRVHDRNVAARGLSGGICLPGKLLGGGFQLLLFLNEAAETPLCGIIPLMCLIGNVTKSRAG